MKIKKQLMVYLRCLISQGLFFLLFVGFPVGVSAQDSGLLPEPVARELKKAQIPMSAVGIYIQPLSRQAQSRVPVISVNGNTPYVTASIMKVVTTYSALEMLGPTYRWKTAAYSTGGLEGDVLRGDLILKGGGDPKFNLESLWLFLRQLRERGIREIRGNLVLDRAAFESRDFDPAAFDDDPSRPYNAGPDALLLNHKVLALSFQPNGLDGTVRVSLSPELDGVTVRPPELQVSGNCNTWKKALSLQFSDREVVLDGGYPLACGDQTWLISPYSMNSSMFFEAVFVNLWKGLGGTFTGKVRNGITPAHARLLAEWQSPALSDVVLDINKYSNNVMARHLLMTLGAESSGEPANPERGVFAVRSFLSSRGIALNGLQMENGSGLSRTERISPQTMGKILDAAYQSPVRQEFVASLPIMGQDGTLQRSMRQTSVAGNAYLKTGAIEEVRAIAGYLLAASGERYVVVFMVNHPNAAAAARARNALLVWLHDKG